MNEEILNAAIEAISQEISREPGNALLLRERGRLHMMAGNQEAAMEDLREAVRLQPDLMSDINGEFRS